MKHENLTIVILTSPIPSNPSLDILDETIFGTREYTDSQILILFDGVHSSLAHRTEDYDKYKEAAINKIKSGAYGDCIYHVFEWHSHQSEMLRYALNELITTDLILFNEHDNKFINEIPLKEICDIVQNTKDINYVRMNIFEQVPQEHEYLFLEVREENGIRLRHTIQYSARVHIAKANWYREILFDHFPIGVKSMVEDLIYSKIISKYKTLGYDTFGLYQYAPSGNQLRSYHSDGRGADPKIITG